MKRNKFHQIISAFCVLLLSLSLLSGVVLANENEEPPANAKTEAGTAAPAVIDNPAAVTSASETVETDPVPDNTEQSGDSAVSGESLKADTVIEEEARIVAEETESSAQMNFVGDNDELLMEYLEASANTGNEAAFSVFGRNHLSGYDLLIYDKLRGGVEKVAAGELSSTEFVFSPNDLGLGGEYTAADLGVASIVDGNTISQAAQDAMYDQISGFNLKAIVNALLYDCPADLYWYEKTAGTENQINAGLKAGYDETLNQYVIYYDPESYVLFRFTVAEDYAVNNASRTYVVDLGKATAIADAINTVNLIIAEHTAEKDWEKLRSYRQEICDAVSYNYPASDGDYIYNYGNPWQLIWVFDNDPSTEVVCEGYSKAFQFLCDESTFQSTKVQSRIVEGTMSGGTGSGPHMWNVVTMPDAKNYLVDVTNSDTGMVGYNTDLLFLTGYDETGIIPATGEEEHIYDHMVYTIGNFVYEYNDDTSSMYFESEIALSGEDYSEEEEEIATPVLVSASSVNGGVKFSWNASEGAERYRVFRKTAGSSWTKVKDTTGTSIIDKTVESGTLYAYTVRCVSADGKSYTSDYDRKGKRVTYIAAPVVNTPASVSGGVKLSWSSSQGAEKYRVYRKAEGETKWTKLGDTAKTGCIDKKAVSGTTYSYTVRCISADGKTYTSAYDTVGKSVTYIAAPVLVSAKSAATGVILTWKESGGAERYRVYRKTEGETQWKKLGDTLKTYCIDKKAVPGTTYSYTVRCFSADGKTSTSGYDTVGISVTYTK